MFDETISFRCFGHLFSQLSLTKSFSNLFGWFFFCVFICTVTNNEWRQWKLKHFHLILRNLFAPWVEMKCSQFLGCSCIKTENGKTNYFEFSSITITNHDSKSFDATQTLLSLLFQVSFCILFGLFFRLLSLISEIDFNMWGVMLLSA